MHGILLWKKNDGAGEKNFDTLTAMHSEEFQTSNLYTWQDQRCSTSFLDSLPAPSNDLQPLSSGHGCATLFWLAKHRRSWLQQKGFTSCGTIMDYLVSLLCGLQHSTTSDQLAASLGYFNTSLSQWDTGLSEAKYFPAHLLPVIKPAGTIAGYVRSSLSFWPDEVGVYVGLGDVQCAMRAVLSSNKDAAINISTSVQLGFEVPDREVSDLKQVSPASISFFPYFDGNQLALCAGMNGGNALHHLVDCIANWMKQVSGNAVTPDTSNLFNRLQLLAEEDKEQCKMNQPALKFRPVFLQERHNPTLEGSIARINTANFRNIGSLFRSASEGLVEHLEEMVPCKYLIDRGIERLLVCGSVAVNNKLVMQKLVDLYEKDGIEVVMNTDGNEAVSSAVGAAMVCGKEKVFKQDGKV